LEDQPKREDIVDAILLYINGVIIAKEDRIWSYVEGRFNSTVKSTTLSRYISELVQDSTIRRYEYTIEPNRTTRHCFYTPNTFKLMD
jgi:hypothetical protein